MLTMHGAAWLRLKTDGDVAQDARRYGMIAGFVTAALFALAGLWLWLGVDGYVITSEVADGRAVQPAGQDRRDRPRGLVRELRHPAPGRWSPRCWLWRRRSGGGDAAGGGGGSALFASAAAIVGIISTVGLAMFPIILPSSIDPRSSLTVWDASSSHMTLFIMLVATAIFLPLILVDTAWVYRVLWGKVDAKGIAKGDGHAY